MQHHVFEIGSGIFSHEVFHVQHPFWYVLAYGWCVVSIVPLLRGYI